MKTILAGATACMLLAACNQTAPESPATTMTAADSPEAAATGFYAVAMALPIGGVPDAAGQAALEPLVTPELAASLAAARAAEDAHTAATNNEEPPMIQGDIYGSLFEGRTAFVVGDCVVSDAEARCEVLQSYSDASGNSEWTDTAVLVRDGDGWRVDDVIYGGDWDFATTGRLSEMLAAVTAGE
ncbi:MAG: hypothetical protein ACFCVH_02040 [Alphaproteobacteria bacterium]